METTKECKANSIRLWGPEKAQEVLDLAQKNGLTVMLGLWMAPERHGFDYSDPIACQEQLEFKRILTTDLQTPANSIDQLVMLPAPNSSNNDVFFFDEFSLLEKPCKDAANALGEQLDDTELLVYPNPVSTELNIQSASPIQSLELLEISGKSCGLFSTLEQLNQELIHTTPGLYVLLVRTENSIKTFKLRKE